MLSQTITMIYVMPNNHNDMVVAVMVNKASMMIYVKPNNHNDMVVMVNKASMMIYVKPNNHNNMVVEDMVNKSVIWIWFTNLSLRCG